MTETNTVLQAETQAQRARTRRAASPESRERQSESRLLAQLMAIGERIGWERVGKVARAMSAE